MNEKSPNSQPLLLDTKLASEVKAGDEIALSYTDGLRKVEAVQELANLVFIYLEGLQHPIDYDENEKVLVRYQPPPPSKLAILIATIKKIVRFFLPFWD